VIGKNRFLFAASVILCCGFAKAGAMKDLHMMVHQSLSLKLFQVEDATGLMSIRSMNFAPQPRAGADFTVQSTVILRPHQSGSRSEELLCFTDFIEIDSLDSNSRGAAAEIEVLRSDCKRP